MMNTAESKVSVFVVEDSDEIRGRIIGMLKFHPEIEVVGEAISAQNAIDGILRTRPTAVVLDLHLTPGSGIDVLREVRTKVPDTMFIVLTGRPDDAYREICLHYGAAHFLDKARDFENVMPIILGLAASSQGPGA